MRFTVSRNENTNPEHFAAAFNPLAGKKSVFTVSNDCQTTRQ